MIAKRIATNVWGWSRPKTSTPKTELQLAGHSQRKQLKGDEERERSEWEEIKNILRISLVTLANSRSARWLGKRIFQ